MAGSNRVKQKTRPQWGLLAALGLIAVLVVVSTSLVGIAFRNPSKGVAGGSLGAQIGGNFNLTADDGKPFTEADLKGKWHLVFFGYTHCPDICPTALNDLSLALDRLGTAKNQVGIVFISVDPGRDTPAVLKSYVESFGGPIVGLTGTANEVAVAAKDYHVYYAKHPTADGGYDMDHSAVIFVMDPPGRFTASFGPDDAPDTIVAQLRKLLG